MILIEESEARREVAGLEGTTFLSGRFQLRC